MSRSTENKIHTMLFKARETDAGLENSGMRHVGSKSASSEIERLDEMMGLIGEKFGKGKITEGLPFLTCSPPWDIGISNGLDIERIKKDIERRKKLTVEERESEDSATAAAIARIEQEYGFNINDRIDCLSNLNAESVDDDQI